MSVFTYNCAGELSLVTLGLCCDTIELAGFKKALLQNLREMIQGRIFSEMIRIQARKSELQAENRSWKGAVPGKVHPTVPARDAPKGQNKHVQIRTPKPSSASSEQEQTYPNSQPLVEYRWDPLDFTIDSPNMFLWNELWNPHSTSHKISPRIYSEK